MAHERRWLKASEVAQYLGVHRRSIYRACRAHKIPCAKVPSIGIRIDKTALDQLLADRRNAVRS